MRDTRMLAECAVPLDRPGALAEHEWLVTNGIGGYSSSTVAGEASRRYHGVLVAALPNPLGRTVMLSRLDDALEARHLRDFRLIGGVPTWRYELDDVVLVKRIAMPHRQNTTVIQYELEEGGPLTLRLAPGIHFRRYEAAVSEPLPPEHSCVAEDRHVEVSSNGWPSLRLYVEGDVRFEQRETRREQLIFTVEEARGFTARGALYSPGEFTATLQPGARVAVVASTEKPEVVRAITADEAFEGTMERHRRLLGLADPCARDGVGAQLVAAADQFIVKPVGRVHDTVRATARGEGIRTVIAGYHWFTDWGRDTMISLEGLTLTTGRHREARFILRTFAQYVRRGLIPNLFPDGSDQGLYHTADATLWFFHALDRFSAVTQSLSLVEQVLPTMRGIADAHLEGTDFGIGVDPADGLLRQGADGYQLTWMDAKVDGWVVTPRRGKAVEINALWHNALCVLASWERELGDGTRAARYRDMAARVRDSFNRRFWYEAGGHLYDVLDGPDGDDPACRPNQVLAISLPNPVLDERRWKDVLRVVREKLLTPVGLRSLAPDHPDYKPKYFGNLRARDAAYHQGTVWGWLIGPWIDAWLKVHPEDRQGARRYLDGLVGHLPDFGVGSIAEIFDAEAPYTPRGCIAQAWSVAEVLRCWVKTA
jgi:predicted glycogen debranching enzyme